MAAADTGLAGIDALTRGVGYGDGAEGRLELLGEPQRDFTRCGCDLVADPRLGMIEKRMGRSLARGEQQQQRDYSGER
jgi:hypothetical protein